jgi:hypothetical protein
MKRCTGSILRLLAAALLMPAALGLTAGTVQAALCVWLNPDRDIKAFFPGGESYTTEIRTYTPDQLAAIQQLTGAPLDPDENEFKFYRVKKGAAVQGTVLTHQARGRYGAVQTVVAIGNDGRIIGVYIQRHREPVNLNQASFLAQFKGKGTSDPLTVGKDITPVAGGEESSRAVAFSVKKILVIHDILSQGKSASPAR